MGFPTERIVIPDLGSAAPKSIGELVGEGRVHEAWQRRAGTDDAGRQTRDWMTGAALVWHGQASALKLPSGFAGTDWVCHIETA